MKSSRKKVHNRWNIQSRDNLYDLIEAVSGSRKETFLI